jgi:hypothetical protein
MAEALMDFLPLAVTLEVKNGALGEVFKRWSPAIQVEELVETA